MCGVALKELNKLDREKPELRAQIAGVRDRIQDMRSAGYIITVASEDDSYFADPVFLSHFHQLRLQTDIMLVTQDGPLTFDVLSINNIRSSSSRYSISVYRINRQGMLRERYVMPDGTLGLMPAPDDSTHGGERTTGGDRNKGNTA